MVASCVLSHPPQVLRPGQLLEHGDGGHNVMIDHLALGRSQRAGTNAEVFKLIIAQEIGGLPRGRLPLPPGADVAHPREIFVFHELAAVVDPAQECPVRIDPLQSMNQNAKHCWVAGFSFGAWIGMQLLMRRPEITGFVSVAPPANMYDFSFLAPCPSSGLIINGTADKVAPPKDTRSLVNKLHEQKGITITHTEIEGADHFFKDEEQHMNPMISHVSDYVKRRLGEGSR